MGTVGAPQTLTWLSSLVYLSPESTSLALDLSKARLVLAVGALVVHSDIPQTQVLPFRLQGFNLQFVQLHREISIPLL